MKKPMKMMPKGMKKPGYDMKKTMAMRKAAGVPASGGMTTIGDMMQSMAAG